MTPERQSEISDIIKAAKNIVPYGVYQAMTEMMKTIGALGEADYVLNVDSTWKAKNKEIQELRDVLRATLVEIQKHNSVYHLVTPVYLTDRIKELLLRE